MSIVPYGFSDYGYGCGSYYPYTGFGGTWTNLYAPPATVVKAPKKSLFGKKVKAGALPYYPTYGYPTTFGCDAFSYPSYCGSYGYPYGASYGTCGTYGAAYF